MHGSYDGYPAGGRLSLYASQVSRQAEAYPGFSSMKRLGVFTAPTPPPSPWMSCLSIAGSPQQSPSRARTQATQSGDERTSESPLLASRLVLGGTIVNNIYQI